MLPHVSERQDLALPKHTIAAVLRNPKLQRWLVWAVGLLIAASAFALRSRQLELRPLHGDEAVQARILADLFEGKYRYDPYEFHGPLLHDLAAPLALAQGQTRWENLTIAPLRAASALATCLLCLTPLLLRRWLGNGGALAAAALLALDPMLFYFGRDYIAEPVFVACLGLFVAAAARAVLNRSRGWAIIAAMALAAAWATKETWVLHLAAAALAALPLLWFARGERGTLKLAAPHEQFQFSALRTTLLWAAAAFLITWLLLFSQAFTSPSGLADSIRSYLHYLARTGGEGHEKPFDFYMRTLFADPQFEARPARLGWWAWWQLQWTQPLRLRPWSGELLVLVLAVLGLIAGLLRWRDATRQAEAGASGASFLRQLAPAESLRTSVRHRALLLLWLFASAALLLLLYSLLRYKTIWSVLGVPALLALPAGVGFAWLLGFPMQLWQRGQLTFKLLSCLSALGLTAAAVLPAINLRAQILWQNFEIDHAVSPENPWVYSQAPTGLLRLPRRISQLADQPQAHPLGNPAHRLQVLGLSRSGVWPLPWYLRFADYGVLADPARLAQLGSRAQIRASIAGFVVGPEFFEQAEPLLRELGYEPELIVQNYANSWVQLWLRDDLRGPAGSASSAKSS